MKPYVRSEQKCNTSVQHWIFHEGEGRGSTAKSLGFCIGSPGPTDVNGPFLSDVFGSKAQ